MTVVHLPERSLVQRQDALEQANRVRTYRANLKRDLRAGRVSVFDVISLPVDPLLETMRVMDALLAVPAYGRVRIGKCLGRAGVSPSKSIGGLSVRQRLALVDAVLEFRPHADRLAA